MCNSNMSPRDRRPSNNSMASMVSSDIDVASITASKYSAHCLVTGVDMEGDFKVCQPDKLVWG